MMMESGSMAKLLGLMVDLLFKLSFLHCLKNNNNKIIHYITLWIHKVMGTVDCRNLNRHG